MSIIFIVTNKQGCKTNCGENEDIDHLFVECDVYGRLWYFNFSWLGFSVALNGKVLQHISQFRILGSFSHKVQNSLNFIWFCVAWII